MKKSKYVTGKNLLATEPKVFSPIDIANFQKQVQPATVDDNVVRTFNKKLIKLANTNDLSPAELIEVLAKLLEINIMTAMQVKDVSPKYFVSGLRMLKLALVFANEICLTNSIITSRENLVIFENRIRELIEDLSITYEEIPASLLNIKNILSELN